MPTKTQTVNLPPPGVVVPAPPPAAYPAVPHQDGFDPTVAASAAVRVCPPAPKKARRRRPYNRGTVPSFEAHARYHGADSTRDENAEAPALTVDMFAKATPHPVAANNDDETDTLHVYSPR